MPRRSAGGDKLQLTGLKMASVNGHRGEYRPATRGRESQSFALRQPASKHHVAKHTAAGRELERLREWHSRQPPRLWSSRECDRSGCRSIRSGLCLHNFSRRSSDPWCNQHNRGSSMGILALSDRAWSARSRRCWHCFCWSRSWCGGGVGGCRGSGSSGHGSIFGTGGRDFLGVPVTYGIS
jgi:hypothetical protein